MPRWPALAMLLGALATSLAAQEPRAPLPPARYEGVPIKLVYVDLRDTAGVELADSTLKAAMTAALDIREGSPFSILASDVGIQRVRALDGVTQADWELYEPSLPGTVVLALRVRVAPGAPPVRKGVFSARRVGDFPTLVESGRALLRVSLNGSLGAFDDRVPWWDNPDAYVGGSPLFPDPAVGSATWTEASIEAGAHGSLEVLPHLRVFGNLTGVGAGSAGQDPWRSDARWEVEIEKAYAGLALQLPGPDIGVMVSWGRQNWQLNKAFLFSQYAGGFNAAEWGASYVAARTTLQQAAFAKVRWANLTLEGFLVDPQEYPPRDSGTEYRGLNLKFSDPKSVELGAVYYEVPTSTSTYTLPDGSTAPRQGLRTVNVRAASTRDAGIKGLFLEAEYAHQSHRDFAMSADAWYADLGYELSELSWRPSLSYRYGFFEGDNPATPEYERFDAPQSSGSDNWLQGNILRKSVVNANVRSHRIRLGASPTRGMSLTLNYFYLWADELNNRGGSKPLQQLSDRHYGQEADLTLGWSLNRRLYLLALAGVAVPGKAIESTVPAGARNWRSLQLSLFWNL